MVEHIKERHLEDRLREVSLDARSKEAWTNAKQSPVRHSAVTLVKQEGLRVILIVMCEGSELPDHRVEAGFTVQMLSGKVRFRVEGEERLLDRGKLFAVARGLAHDLVALEDSALLLTLGFSA